MLLDLRLNYIPTTDPFFGLFKNNLKTGFATYALGSLAKAIFPTRPMFW